MIRDYIRPHFGPHTKVAGVTFADVDALHRKVTPKAGMLKCNPASLTVAPTPSQSSRRLAVEIVLACGALEHAQPTMRPKASRKTPSMIVGAICPVTSWRGWWTP